MSVLLSLCAVILGVPPAAGATTVTSPYVVVYRDGVAHPGTATNALGRELGFSAGLRYASALKGFAARLNDNQRNALQHNPNVAFVAPDTPVHATGLQSLASGETLPAGIRRIGAATPTQVHMSSGVNVAVLDTGINLTNPDLNALDGTNCIKSGASAQDDNGHGTNVAGIIGAKNQGATVVGVAPGTALYSVKVLGTNGNGTVSQIVCGIDWVTAHAAALNIKVVNMSLAGTGSNDNNCGHTNNDPEHLAICNSVAAGITYVAAAGNNKASIAGYIPAAYPEVLTVTAMTDTDGIPGGLGPAPCISGQIDDTYATYSNYAVSSADQLHTVAAPGTCVTSDSKSGGTSTYYGTSQAAPHVAGAVALCMNDGGNAGACAGLTPGQTMAQIRTDAQAAGTLSNGFKGDPLRPISGKYYGYLVNAARY